MALSFIVLRDNVKANAKVYNRALAGRKELADDADTCTRELKSAFSGVRSTVWDHYPENPNNGVLTTREMRSWSNSESSLVSAVSC